MLASLCFPAPSSHLRQVGHPSVVTELAPALEFSFFTVLECESAGMSPDN